MLLMLRAHNNNDASREGRSDRSNEKKTSLGVKIKKEYDDITKSYLWTLKKPIRQGSSSHCSRLSRWSKKRSTNTSKSRQRKSTTLLLLFQTTTTTTTTKEQEEEEEEEEGG